VLLYVWTFGLGVRFITESVEYNTNFPLTLTCCRNEQCFQIFHGERLP